MNEDGEMPLFAANGTCSPKIKGKSEMCIGLEEFHTQDLLAQLDANVVWQSLDQKFRKETLKKNNMLHSPEEILRRAGFDPVHCKKIYAYWSAHTHCDSVAFIRMRDDRRGAGFFNKADISLLGVCLEFANLFLVASTSAVDTMFAGAEKRTLDVAGFNPNSNVQPRRPWAGQMLSELR